MHCRSLLLSDQLSCRSWEVSLPQTDVMHDSLKQQCKGSGNCSAGVREWAGTFKAIARFPQPAQMALTSTFSCMTLLSLPWSACLSTSSFRAVAVAISLAVAMVIMQPNCACSCSLAFAASDCAAPSLACSCSASASAALALASSASFLAYRRRAMCQPSLNAWASLQSLKLVLYV